MFTFAAPPSTVGSRGAIFLPRVMPGRFEGFDGLIDALGNAIEPLAYETEFSAWDELPVNYGIGLEVVRVKRAADGARLRTVHLFGSGGGASIALAFAMRYPHRVASLNLFEPTFLGPPSSELGWNESDDDLMRIVVQENADAMDTIVRNSVAAGATEPVERDLRGKLNEYEGGLSKTRIFVRALAIYPADYSLLRDVEAPVYIAWGSLSHPNMQDHFQRLAGCFSESVTEVYEGRHPFDTPAVAEPQRVASAVLRCWSSFSGRLLARSGAVPAPGGAPVTPPAAPEAVRDSPT